MSQLEPIEVEELFFKRLSRRSFIWAGFAVFGTVAGIKLVDSKMLDKDKSWMPGPFRQTLDLGDSAWKAYYSPRRMIPERSEAEITIPARENGDIGMESAQRADYQLAVTGVNGLEEPMFIDFDVIAKMPKHEQIVEFHCIEGWSQTVKWGGVRLVDFMEKYPPSMESGPPKWLGMMSIDEEYYVAIDHPAALHPQTLLCYEMNGQPLTEAHGAPLRLVIPTKYGVKNIKCLGSIEYTNEPPPDYWAEQGYDYYCGL